MAQPVKTKVSAPVRLSAEVHQALVDARRDELDRYLKAVREWLAPQPRPSDKYTLK